MIVLQLHNYHIKIVPTPLFFFFKGKIVCLCLGKEKRIEVLELLKEHNAYITIQLHLGLEN